MAAPILGNVCVPVVEFDPDEMTPEFQSRFSDSGSATKGIENNASTDRWQIGFPSNGYRLSWNVLPPGILTP